MTRPLCTILKTPLTEPLISGGPAPASIHLCALCLDPQTPPDHFRAIASTMWSDDPATRVHAVRTPNQLDTDWARDLDQLYLDDATQAWADNFPQDTRHKDSKGVAPEPSRAW